MKADALLVILIAYSAALIALGAWIGRRVRASDGFFVGGRSLGAGLIFATMLAPNIGAGSTVGATKLGYLFGPAAWWWVGSAGVGSLVLAFWIGPRIWRVASAEGLLTVGDLLEARFGRPVRGLAAIIIWAGTLFILCGQLDGIATVLAIAGHAPHWLGCLIGIAVMGAYFVAGGLASAARVNGVQLAVKLAGFLLAVPLAVSVAGGWSRIAAAPAAATPFWSSSPAAGWPLLFLLGPAFFISPGLLQKTFGARDARAVTRGVAWNAIALMLFAWIPVALGMAARARHPELLTQINAEPQLALATILADIPLAVGGLALAAVFSSELSAGDAVLFMLSTSGGRDVYQGVFRRRASDAEVLRAARIAAIAGAALAYLLTFVYGDVVKSLQTFYEILVVTLSAPIVGALFLPRGGTRGALAAMVAGVAALYLAPPIGWVTPSLLGLAVSLAVYAASAGLWGPRRRASA